MSRNTAGAREAYEVLTDLARTKAYGKGRLLSGFASSGGANPVPGPSPALQRSRTFNKAQGRTFTSIKPRATGDSGSRNQKPKAGKYSSCEANDTQKASEGGIIIPIPQSRPQRAKPAPSRTKPSDEACQHKARGFSDYYLSNGTEGPLLQRKRANCRDAQEAWWDAVEAARDAKTTVEKFCHIDPEGAQLDSDLKKAEVKERQHEKGEAKRAVRMHLMRARELKAEWMAAEAKVHSADQYAKRAGAKRKREAEDAFGLGSEWEF